MFHCLNKTADLIQPNSVPDYGNKSEFFFQSNHSPKLSFISTQAYKALMYLFQWTLPKARREQRRACRDCQGCCRESHLTDYGWPKIQSQSKISHPICQKFWTQVPSILQNHKVSPNKITDPLNVGRFTDRTNIN